MWVTFLTKVYSKNKLFMEIKYHIIQIFSNNYKKL